MAPLTHVGVQSMAVLPWQPFETILGVAITTIVLPATPLDISGLSDCCLSNA